MLSDSFHKDLRNERQLQKFMDEKYVQLTENKDYEISRVSDSKLQKQGDNLIRHQQNKELYIDEKAQLDYLNRTLATFAFEISYEKKDNIKVGWFIDDEKLTDIYFLISSIRCKDTQDLSTISACNLIIVDRKKLLAWLTTKELGLERIRELSNALREKASHGRIDTEKLNSSTEGYFYFSKENKAEKPINLILRLDNLVELGMAVKLSLT